MGVEGGVGIGAAGSSVSMLSGSSGVCSMLGGPVYERSRSSSVSMFS